MGSMRLYSLYLFVMVYVFFLIGDYTVRYGYCLFDDGIHISWCIDYNPLTELGRKCHPLYMANSQGPRWTSQATVVMEGGFG